MLLVSMLELIANVQTVYQDATVHQVLKSVMIVVLVHMQLTVAMPLVLLVCLVNPRLQPELIIRLCVLIAVLVLTPVQDLPTVQHAL